jgi:hypothetical protein
MIATGDELQFTPPASSFAARGCLVTVALFIAAVVVLTVRDVAAVPAWQTYAATSPAGVVSRFLQDLEKGSFARAYQLTVAGATHPGPHAQARFRHRYADWPHVAHHIQFLDIRVHGRNAVVTVKIGTEEGGGLTSTAFPLWEIVRYQVVDESQWLIAGSAARVPSD